MGAGGAARGPRWRRAAQGGGGRGAGLLQRAFLREFSQISKLWRRPGLFQPSVPCHAAAALAPVTAAVQPLYRAHGPALCPDPSRPAGNTVSRVYCVVQHGGYHRGPSTFPASQP